MSLSHVFYAIRTSFFSKPPLPPLHRAQEMFQSFWEEEPINCKRGFKLAALGASFGCPHNKGVLGCCCVFGKGTAKDEVRGFELGRESSAAGSRIGNFLLGLCYDDGRGVAEDKNLALQSFRLDLPLSDSDVTDEDSDDAMLDLEWDMEEEKEEDAKEEDEKDEEEEN